MTVREFENIKTEIKEKQEQSLKAKGVCEQIQKKWKSEYGFETVEEAKSKLEELESERDGKIARRDKYMNELEELVNGNS